MNKDSDEYIIKKCLGGDFNAFRVIIEKYQLPLYRTALGITGIQQEAEDITQNTFLKAWEKLDTYDPEYKFFSWIYRICVNESLNSTRILNKVSSLEEEQTEDTTPHLELVKNEEHTLLKKAVDKLPEHYKTVIILRHFEELSYQEIADILQIKTETVKSRLFSARNLLKETLID